MKKENEKHLKNKKNEEMNKKLINNAKIQSKKNKKREKKKEEKKEKRAHKLIFYIRTVKRNRNEIEAQKRIRF